MPARKNLRNCDQANWHASRHTALNAEVSLDVLCQFSHGGQKTSVVKTFLSLKDYQRYLAVDVVVGQVVLADPDLGSIEKEFSVAFSSF